ncbi:MAG: matrixin family metalloprotease [Nanoarchaeota archaeon]
MKKIIAVSLILGLMLMSFGIVVAGKNQKQEKEFALPKNAVEVSPGVFYLGKALDKGKVVEGYAFLMKDNMNKQAKEIRGAKVRPPKVDPCYTFLATGAKWRSVEPYIVNPTNTKGLSGDFITSNLAMDINKWENAVNGFDILGIEVDGIVDGADTVSPDNKNEVYFADINSPGAIGITIVWGYFGGRPSSRVLVEWDMVFDDADFDWSATGESGKMDFENIATHELGHAVGMGDLYTSECSEQTMYGYAGYGETKKRDLNTGDIAGIQKLY